MMTAFATINEIPALMHATVLLMSPIRDRHIVTAATVRFAQVRTDDQIDLLAQSRVHVN